jgi:hypothetical protein
LLQAYDVPASASGRGRIVAIVDACADTNVVAELAAYRAKFGMSELPECADSTGVAGPGNSPIPGGAPCIGVVSQRGDSSLPTPDSRWADEIAIDVEMVSAGCPDCSILLVEADSPNLWDLGPAVDEAVLLHASAVSNSYGAPEDPLDPLGPAYSDGDYAAHYEHSGVLITVSSGDDGWDNEYLRAGAPNFPATVPSVLGVGGTDLEAASNARGFAESVWLASTSGCSTETAQPPFQAAIDMGACTMRASVDVAAPASNIATVMGTGWANGIGGTSCAAPFVAGLFTRLGLARQPNSFFYEHADAFFDITEGTNWPDCSDVMCEAGAGWDGPSGLGSPNAAALALLAQSDAGGIEDGGGADAGGIANDSGVTAASDASINTLPDAGGVEDDCGAASALEASADAAYTDGTTGAELTPTDDAGEKSPSASFDAALGGTGAGWGRGGAVAVAGSGTGAPGGEAAPGGCTISRGPRPSEGRAGITLIGLGLLLAMGRRRRRSA